ncbi:MAG: DUF896 domain-containing protein [Clostridia bacterium]|nr:DUF896 domain-containing protein [Clostridia bacterium]
MSNGITKEMIARINELAAKKKSEGLNEEELAEQKALYKDYLAAIRGQVRANLENVRYVEDLSEEELKEELAKRTN